MRAAGVDWPLLKRKSAMALIARFLANESGATAIEYGLIAAGISVVIIAAVLALGASLEETFTRIVNALP
jgi:pilus assembly protein Flp/PilA